MEKQWAEMSPDERQEERLEKWASTEGIEFVSAEAEKAYKESTARLKDAIQLKKLPEMRVIQIVEQLLDVDFQNCAALWLTAHRLVAK